MKAEYLRRMPTRDLRELLWSGSATPGERRMVLDELIDRGAADDPRESY
jgi:hypothetical protein